MIVNRYNVIPLLQEIARLLESNGHPGQANYVSALATVADWDSTAVGPGLASGAMWGGSGSVWEVGEFNSREDRRRFLQLLLQLVDEMRQAGITAPGAESSAAIISNWLKTGII
jgi:hypothetical protein